VTWLRNVRLIHDRSNTILFGIVVAPAYVSIDRATHANGELEIGKMISEAMQKVGNEGVITVEEAKGIQTELEVVEGMQFDCGSVSPYFITNTEKMVAELAGLYILIHEKKRRNCPPCSRCYRCSSRGGRRCTIGTCIARRCGTQL
jgi:hypothetical protein